MNQDAHINPRHALEVSLTALVLGELPPDQEALLRQVLAHDQDLAEKHRRVQHAVGLLREAQADSLGSAAEPLKLSDSRRQQLLQRFKTVVPREFAPKQQRRPFGWLVPVAACLAVMALGSSMLLPALSRSKAKAKQVAIAQKQRITELGQSLKSISRPKPVTAAPNQAGVSLDGDRLGTSVMKNGAPKPIDERFAGGGDRPPSGPVGDRSKKALSETEVRDAAITQGAMARRGMGGGAGAMAGRVADFGLDGSSAAAPRPPAVTVLPPRTPAVAEPEAYMTLLDDKEESLPELLREPEAQLSFGGAHSVITPPPRTPVPSVTPGFEPAKPADTPRMDFAPDTTLSAAAFPGASVAASAETDLTALPKAGEAASHDRLGLVGETLARGDSMGRGSKDLKSLVSTNGVATDPLTEERYYYEQNVSLARTAGRETQEEVARGKVAELPAEAPAGRMETNETRWKKPSVPPSMPVPQPEVATSDSAFSTFSLNVSDVSFKLAAASLESGTLPEPAAIRTEEFINAFDYRDPEAGPGQRIALAWERAQYPFAQNRDVLRLSLKTAAQGRQAGRPLNLVLLLDNSGSMERADRVRIIEEALRVLAGQLQAQDTLSVVTFARTARLWVDGLRGNEAGQVAEQVSGLTPQGGTNLEEGLNLAYQTALRHYQPAGVNRVIVLTDGAANLGDTNPEALKRTVEAHRRQGIALDGFGIGWEGYNDDLLEVLTRNGDGRYGFINTPEEAAADFAGQLAGALRVAASDVKVQLEFNPARVSAYRQLGYAKHQLSKEQFRDNKVDAAEIAASESGTALYVIDVNPQGEGPLAIARVRYKVPGTAEYHEQEWVLPYLGGAPSLRQASPALRLAVAAGAFAEHLAASPYAAEVTPEALLQLLAGVPQVYAPDARPATLEAMVRQARSISGN